MIKNLTFSTFFHALVILAFATANVPIYLLFGLTTLYVIITNFNVFQKLEKVELAPIVFYFASIVLMTIINFFTEPIVAYHLFIATIVMITAIIFTRDPIIYYKSSRITLIAFQAVALLYVAYTGLEGYPAIVPYDFMIKNASANGITSYAVLLQVNFSMTRFLLYRKTSIITSLLTLGVALLGYGRGSIIAAFLILLLNLYCTYAIKTKFKFFIYMVITLFLAISVATYYFDEISLFLEANTKLSAGIVDVARSKILSEYIGEMNWTTFFTGASYTYTSVPIEFNGNPHNSFVRAHHIFGLPYLLFAFIFPFYCIFQKRKIIELFYFGVATLILFFRIFSEPIVLPTIFDFYFFAMFLIIAKTKEPLTIKT